MSVQGSSSLKYSDLFKPPEPTSSTDSPKESEWKVVSHSRGRRRARSNPSPHTSQNTPSPKDSSLVARTDKAATDIFNSAKHKAIETTKRSDQQSRSLPTPFSCRSGTHCVPLNSPNKPQRSAKNAMRCYPTG